MIPTTGADERIDGKGCAIIMAKDRRCGRPVASDWRCKRHGGEVESSPLITHRATAGR